MKRTEKSIPEVAKLDNSKTLEDLRKENEDLRAEVAYLKKLDALVRAKTHAVPKKPKQ
jgi:transposase